MYSSRTHTGEYSTTRHGNDYYWKRDVHKHATQTCEGGEEGVKGMNE